ncbi:MAG: hypothetical protein K6F35_02005 [Lachnospiraceae bacterium]|nr:hypothetical protein [Lachnospiraceae bacterium]
MENVGTAQLTQLQQEQRQKEILEQMDSQTGYEFYQTNLQLDANHKTTEVDRHIVRLQSRIELTQKEKNELTENAPPEPDFQVKSADEVRRLGHFKKKSYNRKVNAYREQRLAWETDVRADRYRSVVGRVEARAEKKEKLEALTGTDGQPLYQEVAATPQAMNQSLKRMSLEGNSNQEKNQGAEDVKEALYRAGSQMGKLSYAMCAYVNETYRYMNTYLRTGEMPPETDRRTGKVKIDERTKKPASRVYSGYDLAELTDLMAEQMKKCRISRDIVVRRGVTGFDTLRCMLGLGQNDVADGNLPELMRRKLNEGEVTLTDKAFVSTAIRDMSGFPAGEVRTYKETKEVVKKMVEGEEKLYEVTTTTISEKGIVRMSKKEETPIEKDDVRAAQKKTERTWEEEGQPGIEFVILVKKGTPALSVSQVGLMGQQASEEELIIGADTKFRVVRAFFNDGKDEAKEGDGEGAGDILKGHKGSWKIYLETIPSADDGEEN